jgi:16S rRNA (uracil1498-N3)-methyltransferase
MTWSTSYTTSPRLFVTASLRAGADIPAPAEQAHYLATVLRRASGDPVRLDGEWMARVTFSRRDQVVLSVGDQLRPQTPEDGPWLVFALLKRDATDLVVRQAVELGSSRLLPVITERTNTARVNEDRLRAIAIEAAEQSERLTIPVIDPPARLATVLTRWPADRRLFAALERSGARTPDRAAAGKKTAILVGPEGGFTRNERENLCRLAFVTPISLGPFVLRAETAATAGQALLLRMGWDEYGAPLCPSI